MGTVEVAPLGRPLRGEVRVPGDKSVSHRALLLSMLASGPSRIRGLLVAKDIAATTAAVRSLGATVDRDLDAGEWIVRPPPDGLSEPTGILDCGNSGTTIRLLCGILASRGSFAVLSGDDSLKGRPMGRVVLPLRRMGATIDGRADGGFAPLAIRGGDLHAAHHDLEVASAQVKSALLLAGLTCGVAVRQPVPTRDHTERMLVAMGANLREDPEGWLLLLPTETLAPVDVVVPGDCSSAAFLLVAAAVVPGSEVTVRDMGLNPTRAGFVEVLEAMGADLTVDRRPGLEPIGDVTVRGSTLRGTEIGGALLVRAIDEIPILAVAAALAEGRTTITGAQELRVKESDRIARVVGGLRALGVEVEEHPDGMTLWGGGFGDADDIAEIDATGDHRIAMAFAVAGLVAPAGVRLVGAAEVSTSYPSFFRDLTTLAEGRGLAE